MAQLDTRAGGGEGASAAPMLASVVAPALVPTMAPTVGPTLGPVLGGALSGGAVSGGPAGLVASVSARGGAGGGSGDEPVVVGETPLAIRLKARIAAEGQISVGAFMDACLSDPDYGYYRCRTAIGATGDFVTAPEISQVFGEILGLWCAVVWQQMGAPRRVSLVEFGPGRGTLMRDALRAMRMVPGLHAALDVHLVEPSPVLAAHQRETLAAELAGNGPSIRWHDDIARALVQSGGVPDGPCIVLANEVLDALRVEQLVHADGEWRRREVGLDADGALAFTLGDDVERVRLEMLPARAPCEGDIIEVRPGFIELGSILLGRRARLGPLAALFLDYGHEVPAFGDTLQAVRGQRAVPVLAAPGEVDLSAQVDFAHFAACCRATPFVVGGLAIDGPVSQAELLGRLGIVERTSRLMAANPSQAAALEAAAARLLAPQAMGSRFKAIGVRSPDLPALPGLEPRS